MGQPSKSAFPLIIIAVTFILATNCLADSDVCPAPAKSIASQINDLCFRIFSTDDVAHPGVVDCVLALSGLDNTCENRTCLKRFRCHLLDETGTLKEMNLNMESCVGSIKSEGLMVQGCEYPFTNKCAERANGTIRK